MVVLTSHLRTFDESLVPPSTQVTIFLCTCLHQCESINEEIEGSDVHFDWIYGDIEKEVTALKAFKAVLRKREFLLEYGNRLFD